MQICDQNRRQISSTAPRRLLLAAIAGLALFGTLERAGAYQAVLADDTFVNTTVKTPPNEGSTAVLTVSGSAATSTPIDEALLQFAFTALPSGTIGSGVRTATLTLYVDTLAFSPKVTSGTVSVYPVTAGTWGEFSSPYIAGTKNVAPTGVTPLTISTTAAATPATLVAATKTTPSSLHSFLVFDVTAAVQTWLNATTNNLSFAVVTSSGMTIGLNSKESTAGHYAVLDLELTGTQTGATGVGIASVTQPDGSHLTVNLTNSTSEGPFSLPPGPTGVGITSVTDANNQLTVNLSNSTSQGPFALPAGVGISSITQPDGAHLTINLTNSTSQGPFSLPAGPTGVGISSITDANNQLTINLTDTTSQGPFTLPVGPAGVGISSITQPSSTQLTVNLTSGTSNTFTLPVGPQGAPGATGAQGPVGPATAGTLTSPQQVALLQWGRPANNTILTGAGSQQGICFDGTYIWVTDNQNGAVIPITASTGVVGTPISLGNGSGTGSGATPVGVCADNAGNIWVADGGNTHSISKINVAAAIAGTAGAITAYRVGPISLATNPTAICFDGTNIWVTQQAASGILYKFLASTGAAEGSVTVGSEPAALCFDGTNIWVVNSSSNTVSVVNATNTPIAVTSTITVGTGPTAICFDGASTWVTNYTAGTLTRINASTLAVVAIPANPIVLNGSSSQPSAICFDGTSVWVTLSTSGIALKVTGGIITGGNTNVGPTPYGICFDGVNLWVINEQAGTVTEF